MPKKRKVDVMAQGKGSLAERLRRRRELLEGGNPQAAQKAAKPRRRIMKKRS